MITLVWMYSHTSCSTGILLEMLALRDTGMKWAHMRATIEATALPSAKMYFRDVRRTRVSSRTARHPPNHTEVVTASNMLALGQRPEAFQRTMIAAVWNPKAIAKTARPASPAGRHRYTTDMT